MEIKGQATDKVVQFRLKYHKSHSKYYNSQKYQYCANISLLSVKQNLKEMATQDQISNIITSLHTSFPNSGFLVMNSNCQAQSMGQTLINYKGLKVIKFDKSEIKQGDYDAVKFNNLCHARCQGQNPAQELGELYQELRSEFPFVQLAVVSGDNYQASGEFSLYKKGNLSVYIY